MIEQLNDITDGVLKLMAETDDLSADRKRSAVRRWGRGTPTWSTPSASTNFATTDPFANGALQFEKAAVDPDTDDVVLAVPKVAAPKLIAVSWPKSVPRDDPKRPAPFVVYLRPRGGQNYPKFYNPRNPGVGGYPLGWDYLTFGLWSYLRYADDALTQPFLKGLPYQVARADKAVVTVLPLPALWDFGLLTSAAGLEELLFAVQDFMFRKVGKIPPKLLGRVALAAFSEAGFGVSKLFEKRTNESNPFLKFTVDEVYLFDISSGAAGSLGSGALSRWFAVDAGKRLRVYDRNVSRLPFYRKIIPTGAATDSPAASLIQGAQGRATAAVLPDKAWEQLKRFPPKVPRWQWVHQLISATMLTDALRRSGFAATPPSVRPF